MFHWLERSYLLLPSTPAKLTPLGISQLDRCQSRGPFRILRACSDSSTRPCFPRCICWELQVRFPQRWWPRMGDLSCYSKLQYQGRWTMHFIRAAKPSQAPLGETNPSTSLTHCSLLLWSSGDQPLQRVRTPQG